MSVYRNNHYVPVWYQERFFKPNEDEKKFYYLDLKPETIISNKRKYKRNEILRWGAKKCFCQIDLYTTKYGEWISTEIEEKFFGPVDSKAREAVEYFIKFTHPSADPKAFHNMLLYLSIQKLRTPKGLAYLAELTNKLDKNHVLIELQRLQQIYCAIWTECVWSIADASNSATKFLLSDHPVTVYNQACFPASKWCIDFKEPDTWLTGTHTIFPLSLDRILILTNLSWVRYPYANPVKQRPNANPFRGAMFNFTQIQTGRSLSEQEVIDINYIIKARAYRYIAAADKSWLYPELRRSPKRWDQYGKDYLLMPDPRSVTFSNEIIVGYKNNTSDSFDAYGRKPWHKKYDDKKEQEREWETFHAFQGEYARKFGPLRRGLTFEFNRLDGSKDSSDFHKYHLSLEQQYKKYRYKSV